MQPLQSDNNEIVLWGTQVVYRHSGIMNVFKRLVGKDEFNNLPSLNWEWNSSTNRRMKTINWQDMTHDVMHIRYLKGLVGIAVRYKSEEFYDFDPDKKHPASVIKVYCLSGPILAETFRTHTLSDGSTLEFRVKHWMDCREEEEIDKRVFKHTVSPRAQVFKIPLWNRRVYLEGIELEKTLLDLARVEDFRALPELKWEWASSLNTSIVEFTGEKMTHPFMSMKSKGEIIAIAVKYYSYRYFQNDPDQWCQAYVVKVYSLKNRLTEDSSAEISKPGYSRIFTIQPYMISSEAHDILRWLLTTVK